MADTYSSVLNVLNKPDEKVLGLFTYGSFVYGTNTDDSDKDFILITNNVREPQSIVEKEEPQTKQKFSFVLHNQLSFQKGLWAHEPYAIETFFLPKEHILKNVCTFDFTKVDTRVLRHSFSQKASHSYVKAKKKFEVEGDIRRAKKSLFHSLRIMTFGIQLGEQGKITDFMAANHFWWDIYTDPKTDWQSYEKKYRPVYNGLCTRFRELCQK